MVQWLKAKNLRVKTEDCFIEIELNLPSHAGVDADQLPLLKQVSVVSPFRV